MEFDIETAVNPRVLSADKYDMKLVTTCWRHEEDVLRAMSNESPYPPLQSVRDAVKRAANRINWYPEDAAESAPLRTKLASYASLSPENVSLANGSMELLDLLFHIFIAQPEVDEVILPAPDYTPYPIRAHLFGARTKLVPGGEDVDKLADGVIEAITEDTKFILLSRPNNPTGKVMPGNDLLRILDSGVLTVVDEAYIEFAEEGTTVASWIDSSDNLIILRTLSKAFGLAGLRLGYVLAKPQLIELFDRARAVFNVNLVAMLAASAALDDLERVRQRVKEQCQTREWLEDQISQIPGLRPVPSQANYVLVSVEDPHKNAAEIVQALFPRGFCVRDMSSKPGLASNRYFRITVGRPPDMERLVHEIRALVE